MSRIPPEGEKEKPWLGSFLRRGRKKTAGDVIGAEIGEDARGVAVGKNIIQIGTLKIPLWAIILVTAAVVVAAGTAIVAGRQVGEIAEVLVPSVMPAGHFNIAVAAFDVADELIGEIPDDESKALEANGAELSSTIANYLVGEKDALRTVLIQDIEVWGPDKGVPSVAPGNEEEVAAALNAQVLIYGRMARQENGQIGIEPKFFLTDSAVEQAEELGGDHALGKSIPYRSPENAAYQADVRLALSIRTDALARMLMGLSNMAKGDRDGYRKATTIFQDAVDNSAWAADLKSSPNVSSGQEILYLFLGNGYLSQAFVMEDEASERQALLLQSREAFSTSISLNDRYARAYIGRGAALFQTARPRVSQDACEWVWGELDEAAASYTTALSLPEKDKPLSGQVDYRANFGLGRVYFWKGYCLEPDQWVKAQERYRFVVDEYERMVQPIPHLIDIAAYAHTDLGFMELVQADAWLMQEDLNLREQGQVLLTSSIDHYARSLELTGLSGTEEGVKHATEAISYYLTALCIDHQGERALSVLDTFVAGRSDPATLRSHILAFVDSEFWEDCVNGTDQ